MLTASAVVPAIWRLEVVNSLQSGLRRKCIDAAFRDAPLTDLGLLNIVTDLDTDRFVWSATLQLAERLVPTLHDAAHLELAQRRSLALATLDQPLRTAAETISVPLLGIDS